MDLWQCFSRSRKTATDRSQQGDYIVETMEPRVLLSADALGIDAGVLDTQRESTIDFDNTIELNIAVSALTIHADTDDSELQFDNESWQHAPDAARDPDYLP